MYLGVLEMSSMSADRQVTWEPSNRRVRSVCLSAFFVLCVLHCDVMTWRVIYAENLFHGQRARQAANSLSALWSGLSKHRNVWHYSPPPPALNVNTQPSVCHLAPLMRLRCMALCECFGWLIDWLIFRQFSALMNRCIASLIYHTDSNSLRRGRIQLRNRNL